MIDHSCIPLAVGSPQAIFRVLLFVSSPTIMTDDKHYTQPGRSASRAAGRLCALDLDRFVVYRRHSLLFGTRIIRVFWLLLVGTAAAAEL